MKSKLFQESKKIPSIKYLRRFSSFLWSVYICTWKQEGGNTTQPSTTRSREAEEEETHPHHRSSVLIRGTKKGQVSISQPIHPCLDIVQSGLIRNYQWHTATVFCCRKQEMGEFNWAALGSQYETALIYQTLVMIAPFAWYVLYKPAKCKQQWH